MNKYKDYIFIIIPIIISLVFYGCTNSKQQLLEESLKFSGNNCAELKKVLSHYHDDSLKLMAAKFLIINMRDKYYYVDSELDSIKADIKNASGAKGYLSKSIREKWAGFSYRNMQKIYDLQVVSSDFIIENIDLAFESWHKYEWGKNFSFDDFCQYILPYRIADEPLENWRRKYRDYFLPVLDSLYQGTDIVAAANCIQHYLSGIDFSYNKDFNVPHYGASFLLNYRIGTCRDNADFMVYLFRTLGIPIAIDTYIYSPDCRLGHIWNAMKDTTGRFIPIELRDENIKRNQNEGRSRGKVYRYCFERQKQPIFNGDYYMKDVTTDYCEPNQIEIPEIVDKHKKGLISVFSYEGWIPVGEYETHNGHCFVRNIERNVIFQPLLWGDNRIYENGYPFILQEDTVKTFIPDLKKTEHVKLTRKYPVTKNLRRHLYRMNGAHFEGSNNLAFEKFDTLALIQDSTLELRRILHVQSYEPYRYIKFCSPPEANLHTAEISVYADSLCTEPIDFKIIQCSADMHGTDETEIKNAFDGNVLTYYLSAEKNAFYVMDLGLSRKIRSIVFTPRNDDNFVCVGDCYELLYQGGIDGWISLGKKIASDDFVEFDSVPTNALLRLHDVTKGIEEQVFWWNGSKQIFQGHLK